jgi:hypothetical protein
MPFILEIALEIAVGIIVVGLLIALGLFSIAMIIRYPWQTALAVTGIILLIVYVVSRMPVTV